MKKYILMAVLGLSVLFAGAAYVATEQRNIPEVTVEMCKSEDVPVTFTCSGTVRAAESKSVVLSDISVVTEVYVKKGDVVSVGDGLFTVCSFAENGSDYSQQLLSLLTDNGEGVEELLSGDYSALYSLLPDLSADAADTKGESRTVTAPLSGTVTEVALSSGDVILPGVLCVTVADLSSLRAELSVPENYVYKLSAGQTATVTIKGANARLNGAVTDLAEKITQTSSLLGQSEKYAKITVTLPGNASVLPGMSCSAKITTETLKNVFTVPYEAICEDGDGNAYVYTTEDERVKKLTVRTGLELEDRVVVYTEDDMPFYYFINENEQLQENTRVHCIAEK